MDNSDKKPQEKDNFDDPKMEAAVDDIVVKEGDDALATEDEKIAQAFEPKKQGFFAKIGGFFSRWWHNRMARNLTLVSLVLLAVGLMVVPATRHSTLNLFGVRASATLKIVDDGTKLPLRNVKVRLQGQESTTDEIGQASFKELKLGDYGMEVERRAFATLNRKVTIGWGSNPLGDISLRPVGSQYTFQIEDFLSGKPVGNAEAVGGNSDAFSDENGKLVLTVDDPEVEKIEIAFNAEGYREEVVTINADETKPTEVKLVASRPHVFVSNRSGRFDVYKIDVDGKNEAVILAATGSESRDMTVLPHPSRNLVAVDSTRTNIRNAAGALTRTLNLVDVDNGTVSSLLTADRLQIIGWVGDKLVYKRSTLKIGETGVLYEDRLHSYDIQSGKTENLSATGSISSALLAGNTLFYSLDAQAAEDSGLYSITVGGKAAAKIHSGSVWNLLRDNFDRLVYLTEEDGWYEYHLTNKQTRKLDGQPSGLNDRIYIGSPDGKNYLWSELRDGRGALIKFTPDTRAEEVLHRQGGLGYPIRWLTNRVAVYRISTGSETADYVVSLDGGEPIKVNDATNINSGSHSGL